MDCIIKPIARVSIVNFILSICVDMELESFLETQYKVHRIFTISAVFPRLVDLKPSFSVVNFRIHLLFSQQEIQNGFIMKINLIMHHFIWLILPLFGLIVSDCTFLVGKVRATRTFD